MNLADLNLEHLNLDLHGVEGDNDTKIILVLIASELKCNKLLKALTQIGCDACFCVPDLSDLVLALLGFDERSNDLYDYYFELLNRYCEEVTYTNKLAINEAITIYEELKVKEF